MTTAGQFPYHFSNGIFDGELLTALQKPKKNKPTIRITTAIKAVLFGSFYSLRHPGFGVT